MTKGKGNDKYSVYSLLSHIVKAVIIVGVITFLPGLPPDMTFDYLKLTIQPVALNGKLNNAERLFLNQVKGPEDVVVYNNELYTSTHGGYIKKLVNGKLIPVIKFGKDCNDEDIVEEDLCGRPLGFRFDDKGLLYVADAYYGIKKVNLSSGEVQTIVRQEDPIDDLNPMIPNSIAISKKTGDFYWTDSSTSHFLKDGLFTLLGNGNGRLLKYNSGKKKNEVLINNIHFANGVALSADESFLVVAETFGCRLLKYNLKGPNAGNIEVFSHLPGFPDNINYYNGKFIVSIVLIPDRFLSSLFEWPLIRKFAARSLALIEYIVQEFDKLYPCRCFKKINHWIGHFESFDSISSPVGAVVLIIDEAGHIVETLSSTDNSLSSISSMVPYQGYYYLGSPSNPYLGRVKVV